MYIYEGAGVRSNRFSVKSIRADGCVYWLQSPISCWLLHASMNSLLFVVWKIASLQTGHFPYPLSPQLLRNPLQCLHQFPSQFASNSAPEGTLPYSFGEFQLPRNFLMCVTLHADIWSHLSRDQVNLLLEDSWEKKMPETCGIRTHELQHLRQMSDTETTQSCDWQTVLVSLSVDGLHLLS